MRKSLVSRSNRRRRGNRWILGVARASRKTIPIKNLARSISPLFSRTRRRSGDLITPCRYPHSFWYKASREIFEDTRPIRRAELPIGAWRWGYSTIRTIRRLRPTCRSALPLFRRRKPRCAETSATSSTLWRSCMSTTTPIPHPVRVQSYLKAMEVLAAKYPDDDEAQIFYAITLNVAASPTE